MGSVTIRVYQLAFFTPGIKPRAARLRKQMRQMPNLRYTARGLPHKRQRYTRRVENFGLLNAFKIFALHAMQEHFPSDSRGPERHAELSQ